MESCLVLYSPKIPADCIQGFSWWAEGESSSCVFFFFLRPSKHFLYVSLQSSEQTKCAWQSHYTPIRPSPLLHAHNNTGSLPSKSLKRGRPRHPRFFKPRSVAGIHREASVHFRVGPVSLCPRYRIGLAFTSLHCGSCSARIEVAAAAAAIAAAMTAADAAAASTDAEHGSRFHSRLLQLPYDFL